MTRRVNNNKRIEVLKTLDEVLTPLLNISNKCELCINYLKMSDISSENSCNKDDKYIGAEVIVSVLFKEKLKLKDNGGKNEESK